MSRSSSPSFPSVITEAAPAMPSPVLVPTMPLSMSLSVAVAASGVVSSSSSSSSSASSSSVSSSLYSCSASQPSSQADLLVPIKFPFVIPTDPKLVAGVIQHLWASLTTWREQSVTAWQQVGNVAHGVVRECEWLAAVKPNLERSPACVTGSLATTLVMIDTATRMVEEHKELEKAAGAVVDKYKNFFQSMVDFKEPLFVRKETKEAKETKEGVEPKEGEKEAQEMKRTGPADYHEFIVVSPCHPCPLSPYYRLSLSLSLQGFRSSLSPTIALSLSLLLSLTFACPPPCE